MKHFRWVLAALLALAAFAAVCEDDDRTAGR